MNQLALALMDHPPVVDKTTLVYSYRAAVQKQQRLFSPPENEAMCQNAEKVLVVRHPILRIISAWNDKFNLNNTADGAGLKMGINILKGLSKGFFANDLEVLNKELEVKL